MIKKLSIAIILFIIAILVVLAGYISFIHTERPQNTPLPISNLLDQAYMNESQQADEWMKLLYAQHQLPSLSVAVGINGQLAWQGAIGYADLANEKLADTNTLYRIGSISKPMTAAVTLRLQEKNLLDIDQPLSKYLKDYSAQHSMITIKQLLTHQAGIRHYKDEIAENFSFTEYPTTRQAATIVEQDPLLFEPGHGFNYTTYGYTILSLVMESAANRSFDQLMQEELLSPLQLKETRLNKEKQLPANSSVPYIEIDHSLYKSPEPNVSNKYAGGGFISTPSDLVKFGNALLDEKFLGAKTRQVLWEPVPLANGQMNPENYALGFRTGMDELGRFVHHGGKSVGGYSFLIIYPDSNLVIAFASNVTPQNNSFDRIKEAKKLADIFSK